MLNIPEARLTCRKPIRVKQEQQQDGLRKDAFPSKSTFAPLGLCLSKVEISSVREILSNEDACKQINAQMLGIWLSMQDTDVPQDGPVQSVAPHRPQQKAPAHPEAFSQPFIKQEPM